MLLAREPINHGEVLGQLIKSSANTLWTHANATGLDRWVSSFDWLHGTVISGSTRSLRTPKVAMITNDPLATQPVTEDRASLQTRESRPR